jgi:hypothetical protein
MICIFLFFSEFFINFFVHTKSATNPVF